jgi:hypothetical protein
MLRKRTFPAPLLVLFCGLLVLLGMLSACTAIPGVADPSADPPASIGVTPIDTSPGTLIVTVTINEDQDATDRTSNITLQFSTRLIEEANYVLFDNGNEVVVCNGVPEPLGSAQLYTFHIPNQRYTCMYSGNIQDHLPLDPVPMFDFAPRSRLSPKLPSVTSSGFSIRYRPDSDVMCTIIATAKDSTGDPDVVGNGEPSNKGVYNGPAAGSLQGNGEILLTRTCPVKPPENSPFHLLSITYISTASVEVTWSH